MAGMDTHYKFTIRLMTILGLWPYVSRNFRRIQSAVVNCICTSFVTVQITPLTTGEVDLTLLLQCLCFIVIFMGSIVKFNTYMAQIGTVRTVMDGIKSTWDTEHEDTLEILRRRANLGKQQGVIYALFIYPSGLLLMVLRTSSYFMVVTAPPNSNLTEPFPVMSDYLIGEEKYFFLIMIHQNLTILISAAAYVATENLYIMWLQHSISLLELASYHIEKGVSERPPYISQEVMEVYRKKCLATAVTYHIEAKALVFAKSYYTRREMLIKTSPARYI